MDDARAIRLIWALIALLALASVVSIVVLGVGFKLRDSLVAAAVAAGLIGVAAFYRRRRPDARIERLLRGNAELFLLSFLCGGLSYAAAALDRPLWDATFQAWDEVLGFDWRFWLAVLDAHPSVHVVLATAYHSMLPQLGVIVIALATARAFAEIDRFLVAFGLAALVTVAIAALMPALSPLVHLGITAADHPHITLAVPTEFADHALALRNGTLRMVDLSGAQGLVTFPSFHTASAVLLALGFWHVPWLRWPALVLNGLMLAAVPIEGSHYLVDLLAGTAVALAAWAGAGAALRRPDPARLPSVASALVPSGSAHAD